MGSSLAYAAAHYPDYIDADDAEALFERGMIVSSGSGGTIVDLVEAHKWFNLAALAGSEAAMSARAELAEEMTPRQISLAQKAARAFLVEARA